MALVVGLTAILGLLISAYIWTPAAPAVYKLPWAAGQRYEVLQGNYQSDMAGGCLSGCSTHNDDSMRFAWDFDLPEGTEVLAARSGTVALMNGSWPADHCGQLSGAAAGQLSSQFIGNEANFVEIDHGDGTSALYLHLSEVSPEIEQKAKSGEPVSQGEVLGRSGRTGYTHCEPHLHFQVENSVRADWFTTSQPIAFGDEDVMSRTSGGVPVERETYVSDNAPPAAR